MSVCVKESGQLIKTAGLYRSEVPIGIADIYTEGERQIGIFTDGKPLYQKTVDCGALPANTTKNVAHGITNIDRIVSVRGCAFRSTSGIETGIPIPSTHYQTIGNQNEISVNFTNIVLRNGNSNASSFDKTQVTIQYTKTTDTATGALPNSSSSIYMMGDVSISSPQDGQALVFDATDNKWKNGEGGGGGTANIWAGTQEELEEEFDDIPDDTQIVVYDDYQEVVEGGTIYSEEEQVIGLWTDNRPLYQKTFKTTSPSAVNTSTDVVNLEGYNIAEVTNMSAYIEVSANITPLGGNSFILWHRRHTSNQNATIACQVSNSFYLSSDLYITIQYTKSTDAPLDLVVGKSTMYIASSDCYSTEEKEVGCHVDGKPLYQKTILHTGIFTGSNDLQTIAHNISNLDECVSINGFIYDAHETNPSWMPLPRFYTSNAFGISHITTSDIYIYIPSAFGTRLRNARITLQYTKTTDTAGSGTYTPANGKAVHYSENEQVIGTWIDGSTLYRKTIHKVNMAVTNGTEITHEISNLAMCIKLEAVCYDEGSTSFPLMSMGSQYADNSSERSMGFRCNSTKLIAYGKNEFSGLNTRHWYFTLEYTKSVS